ncbi:tRNA (cytidine(34)-2'-O)-methyltransferase [Peptostreptococcaceae bacterium AGR-M142]
MAINIVLVEPEIPQNTGNIIRTCVVTGANLHLIRPLGFSLNEKSLKRAGMDYVDMADIKIYDCLDEFFQINKGCSFYLATTKADKNHSDVDFKDGDFILFGKESKGLDEDLIFQNMDKSFRVPMKNLEYARSLNLSNTVAIVTYEALRQIGYSDLR